MTFFGGPEALEKQGQNRKFARPRNKIHPRSALQDLGIRQISSPLTPPPNQRSDGFFREFVLKGLRFRPPFTGVPKGPGLKRVFF